jgi:nitroreductase
MPQKTITDDDIKFILETAHLSPSSFGFEPWYFIVFKMQYWCEQNQWLGSSLKLDTASHFVLGLSMKAPLAKARFSIYCVYAEGCKKTPADGLKYILKFYENFKDSDFGF